jgi:hypothetical protein
VAPFPQGWCGTDLGSYRPCPATYLIYPYEDQPVLDEAVLTGDFGWLGEPGEVDDKQAARLSSLDDDLRAAGLALPDDFVRFYSHPGFADELDNVSVTACYTDLSPAPFTSPAAPSDRMVRFLRDQQDCVFWYLYLSPQQAPCVVFSFEDVTEPVGQAGDEPARITWCAPSFQHFAYRYWLENQIWPIVNGEVDDPLTEEMRAYVDQFSS